MATPSQSTAIKVFFHHGGYFETNPIKYQVDIVSSIENVDMLSMDFVKFVAFLEKYSISTCKRLFFLESGKDLQNGLRLITCDADVVSCREHALDNQGEIHIYMAHSDVNVNLVQADYNVPIEEEVSYCDEEGETYIIYSSDEDEDETASLDHLSDGEDEIVEVRTKKSEPRKQKRVITKMFDDDFLARIYTGLEREKYTELKLNTNDEDNDVSGKNLQIHDPNIKWKLMRPHLGEKYEGPDQLKRCLAFYALSHGFKLFYKVNDYRRLLVMCSKDESGKAKCTFRLWASWMQNERTFQIKTLNDEHCCSRTFEFGSLITCNWIARNFANKIMTNPNIKNKEVQEAVLKKYKCKVSIGQAKRGKYKALQQYETCLEDHYGKLWSYGEEILTSNPGSTCLLSLNCMPDGKNYFQKFYVCFKGLKDGWLARCRRVIGLDGSFLKTICKGELLSAVGRDGNNQVYPIAWAVVNVENKENWKWFMECLIGDLGLDYGEGLTIISDQHKGIVEAAKEVMPLAEHRQCARHIYANFRKRFSGILYRNLFWKAAKASYPSEFEKVMKDLKDSSNEAHKYLMERHPESWSRAFFKESASCDAVENGVSECFNALIVDARRKPIISMLEDIRTYMMDRMKKMRDKHAKWKDEICPSIRKKFEIIKNKHSDWKVFHSGESKFEVKNGWDGFRVDEHSMTCSCRQWQLVGMPCEHGVAVIYALHKDPDMYVTNWYKKPMFEAAYNHYIYPLVGMSQWPSSDKVKPLPPIARRMPGRPKHKRRRDVSERNDTRTRNRVTCVGRIMHCQNCQGEGHNISTCKQERRSGIKIRKKKTGVAKDGSARGIAEGVTREGSSTSGVTA